MNADERRKKLMDILMEVGKVRVSDLIDQTGISPATLRRDLSFLESTGYVDRTHGYARYLQPDMIKQENFSPEIRRIAKVAASLVKNDATIFLDSGLAPLALGYELMERDFLTVITNSIPVAQLYSSCSNIQAFVTGGYLQIREAALVGDDAIDYIKRFHTHQLFLSTTGVRVNAGFTCVTPLSADVKKAMVDYADEVIVLAQKEKLERDALRVFAPLEKVNTIITSAPISDPVLKSRIEELGIRLIVAGGFSE